MIDRNQVHEGRVVMLVLALYKAGTQAPAEVADCGYHGTQSMVA